MTNITKVDGYGLIDGYAIDGNVIFYKREPVNVVSRPDGYVQVVLTCTDNVKRMMYVHRVMLNVYDPIDNWYEMVCDHGNGIRDDNRMDNISWVTQSENIKRAIARGSFTQHKQTKIDDNTVHNICRLLESGKTPKVVYDELCIGLPIKLTTVQKIASGKIRVDVSSQYNISSRKYEYMYDWSRLVKPTCEMLSDGFTTRAIADVLNFNTTKVGDRQKFWHFVSRIKRRKTYTDISDNYKF